MVTRTRTTRMVRDTDGEDGDKDGEHKDRNKDDDGQRTRPARAGRGQLVDGWEGGLHRVLGALSASAPSYIRTRRRPNAPPHHAQREARPSCSVLRGLVSGLGTFAARQRPGPAMRGEQERSPEWSDASRACVRALCISDARTRRRVASRLATCDVILPLAPRQCEVRRWTRRDTASVHVWVPRYQTTRLCCTVLKKIYFCFILSVCVCTLDSTHDALGYLGACIPPCIPLVLARCLSR